MGTDIGATVRRLLLECMKVGIEIELDGNNLKVRGSSNRADLLTSIKHQKKDIVHAMQNLPDAVETHYLSRLRKGKEWLNECIKRINTEEFSDPDNNALTERLVHNMVRWALLDDELRRIYPEFRGCSLQSIGGCDDGSELWKIVRCQECADDVLEATWKDIKNNPNYNWDK